MNIIIDKFKFNKYNVFFKNKTKNINIEKKYFYHIIYSNSLFVLNNITFILDLNIKNTLFNINNNKYYFDIENTHNKKNIEIFINIEQQILSRISIKDKIPKYKIQNILSKGMIQINKENYYNSQEKINYNDNDNDNDNYYDNSNIKNLILRISGICELENEYCLLFNIMKK